jgi:hypothetical protein
MRFVFKLLIYCKGIAERTTELKAHLGTFWSLDGLWTRYKCGCDKCSHHVPRNCHIFAVYSARNVPLLLFVLFTFVCVSMWSTAHRISSDENIPIGIQISPRFYCALRDRPAIKQSTTTSVSVLFNLLKPSGNFTYHQV